jgi:hypothetical protein
LQQGGFSVGRYVSLERLVEESRDDYYRILGECSVGWGSGKNEILPWWNYFLGIIRRAYCEFGQQVEGTAGSRVSKGSLVRQVVLDWVGDFTLAEVRAQVPGVSEAMVKVVLGQMRSEGLVTLTGHGRSARWQRR